MWFFRFLVLILTIVIGVIFAGPFQNVIDTIREAIPFNMSTFDTAILMILPLFFLIFVVFIMPLIRFLRGTDEFDIARKQHKARKSILSSLPNILRR